MKRAIAPLMCLSLCLGACDCEQQVRKTLSNGDKDARKGQALPKERLRSTPMEKEPNTTSAQATPIVLDTELRAIEGILDTGDEDWFALSCTCEGEPWVLKMFVEPIEASTNIALTVQLGTGTARYDVTTSGAETIPVLALSQTPTKISVRALAGQGAYTIRFERRLSGGLLEAEPNDIPSLAWSMLVPGELQGFYDRVGDRDVLALNTSKLDKSKLYTLQVSGIEGATQTIETSLSSDMATPWLTPGVTVDKGIFEVPNLQLPTEQSTMWIALSAGEFASRQRPYRVKMLPLPDAPKGVTFEREPNDQQPGNVVTSSTQLKGYVHLGDAIDRVRITIEPSTAPEKDPQLTPPSVVTSVPKESAKPSAPTDQRDFLGSPVAVRPSTLSLPARASKVPPTHVLDVILKAKDPNLHLSAALTDENGKGIDERPPSQSVRVACRKPMAVGSYDLLVRHAPQPELSAQLDARVWGARIGIEPWQQGMEIEPNDSREQADPMAYASKVTGVLAADGDVDVYVLDLPDAPESPNAFGQYVHDIRLVLSNHPANLAMQIHDAQGTLMAKVNQAGQGAQELYVGQWPQGRYFVTVSAVSGTVCVPYVLTWKTSK